jgi:uncharacterized OB-fold protein
MPVRRCLGCGETYPPDWHACPACGSHAGEVEEATAAVATATPATPPAAGRRPAKPRRKT